MPAGGGPEWLVRPYRRPQSERAAPAGQRGQDARLARLVVRRVPATLDDAVVPAVPGHVLGVPHPRGELQEHLRVAAQRLLVDGPAVPRRDGDPAQVDRAEQGERNGQHDVIGRYVAGRARALEAAPVPAARMRPDGHQPLAEVQHPARQPGQDAGDQLVVAAVDVPLLVRAGQLRLAVRLVAAGRAVVLAEQVHQVQRRGLRRPGRRTRPATAAMHTWPKSDATPPGM